MEKEKLLETMELHIEKKAGQIAERCLDVKGVSSIKEVMFSELIGMCYMYTIATNENGMGDYFRAVFMATEQLEKKACEKIGADLEEARESVA